MACRRLCGVVEIGLARPLSDKQRSESVAVHQSDIESARQFEDIAFEYTQRTVERLERTIARIENGECERGEFSLSVRDERFLWELTLPERNCVEQHLFGPQFADYSSQPIDEFLVARTTVRRTHYLGEHPFVDFLWFLNPQILERYFEDSHTDESGVTTYSGLRYIGLGQGFPRADKIEVRRCKSGYVGQVHLFNLVTDDDEAQTVLAQFPTRSFWVSGWTQGCDYPATVEVTTYSPADGAPYGKFVLRIDDVVLCDDVIASFDTQPQLENCGTVVHDYRFWNGQPTQYPYDNPPTDRQFVRMAERQRQARAAAAGCHCKTDADCS